MLHTQFLRFLLKRYYFHWVISRWRGVLQITYIDYELEIYYCKTLWCIHNKAQVNLNLRILLRWV
jgi:hypothetical protein